MRTSLFTVVGLLAAASLALTGCGTTETAADATTDPADAISIVDDRGETIELAAAATTVVALEWNTAEYLVALGVMPAGVADVTGYGSWVQAAPLDESVVDVGQRGEPSIDAIAGLAPDLVLSTSDLSESAIAQIEEIAPVLVVRGADASDGIGQMEKNLEKIATATGTEQEATELISTFEEKLASGAAEIEAAGLGGAGFALSDAYAESGQVSIRPYLAGSLLSDVTEQLGLVNAWEGEGDADYGLGASDVEGLTALPADVSFFYLGAADSDPYADELAANPIWTSLPFVQAGAVYRLPEGIWPFGGPASMMDYVDAVVDTLTA